MKYCSLVLSFCLLTCGWYNSVMGIQNDSEITLPESKIKVPESTFISNSESTSESNLKYTQESSSEISAESSDSVETTTDDDIVSTQDIKIKTSEVSTESSDSIETTSDDIVSTEDIEIKTSEDNYTDTIKHSDNIKTTTKAYDIEPDTSTRIPKIKQDIENISSFPVKSSSEEYIEKVDNNIMNNVLSSNISAIYPSGKSTRSHIDNTSGRRIVTTSAPASRPIPSSDKPTTRSVPTSQTMNKKLLDVFTTGTHKMDAVSEIEIQTHSSLDDTFIIDVYTKKPSVRVAQFKPFKTNSGKCLTGKALFIFAWLLIISFLK